MGRVPPGVHPAERPLLVAPVGAPGVTHGCSQCHPWVLPTSPMGAPSATRGNSQCHPRVPPISPLGAPSATLGDPTATPGCPQYHPWVPPVPPLGARYPTTHPQSPSGCCCPPPSHQLSPREDGTEGGFGVPEGLRRAHRGHVLRDRAWGNTSKGDPQGVPNPIPTEPRPHRGDPTGAQWAQRGGTTGPGTSP